MRRWSNLFQIKQMKFEQTTSEMKINNLTDKQFKILVMKMLTELEETRDEQSDNFNKELKDMKKENYQSWLLFSCSVVSNFLDCSMPSFPVLHCLLEFAQTHAH